jgi:WD40 repeat protein
LFQPELMAEGVDGTAVIHKRHTILELSGTDPAVKAENDLLAMLYRRHVEFAVGHGIGLQGHPFEVLSVAFSPDGKTLASASQDRTIKLWDVATGNERSTLHGHTESVASVSFSPDGKTLASGSWDSTIKLWDVPSTKKAGK